jgi:transcription elongation factor Elf1
MEGHGHLPQRQSGLELCPDCGRPFVVPVALLDLVDEGLYLIALQCKNCERLAVGIHEDAELEALEAFSAEAAARIEAALDRRHDLVHPDDS